ncbi:hypothetical protein RhiJN_16835 [Ceratobasidium sp. AG-Ba]|nr:hypothetical protein RhiJN_16835 [Ceratobasidium sp. AG-Ba]
MSGEPTQTDIIIAQTLTRIAGAIYSTFFLAVASLVVMMYDTIITLDQEACPAFILPTNR